MRNHSTIILTLTIAALSVPLVAKAKQARCRMPGQPYSLAQGSLPLCRTPQRHTAELTLDDVDSEGRAAARAPASVTPQPPKINVVTFATYLRDNSSDPALSTRITGMQDAFVDPQPVIVNTAASDEAKDPTSKNGDRKPASTTASGGTGESTTGTATTASPTTNSNSPSSPQKNQDPTYTPLFN